MHRGTTEKPRIRNLWAMILVASILLAPLGASARNYTAAHKIRRGLANTTGLNFEP